MHNSKEDRRTHYLNCTVSGYVDYRELDLYVVFYRVMFFSTVSVFHPKENLIFRKQLILCMVMKVSFADL